MRPAQRLSTLSVPYQARHGFRTTAGKSNSTPLFETLRFRLRSNLIPLARAVLVFYVDAFNDYLDWRMYNAGIAKSRHGWGPYCANLAHRLLLGGKYKLDLHTVLCADVSRQIRNHIVHDPKAKLPLDSNKVPAAWRTELEDGLAMNWKPPQRSAAVQRAFRYVIGEVPRQVAAASASVRDTPAEFFYAVFTFTNLDKLAFQIEEALATLQNAPGTIKRRACDVNNKSLIRTVVPSSTAPRRNKE